jgi:hypothetical protein
MKSSSETAMVPILSMEDRMKLSIMTTTLALYFALAPFGAQATALHTALPQAEQGQRYAIPMPATAFGDREECTHRGCIDKPGDHELQLADDWDPPYVF